MAKNFSRGRAASRRFYFNTDQTLREVSDVPIPKVGKHIQGTLR
jgi:hypothetical protein